MTAPNDPTELAGVADADTQSAFAWATEQFEGEPTQGWLTAGRITGVAVGFALLLIIAALTFGVLKLHPHESAAPAPSPVATPSATMTTVTAQPAPQTVAIAIPTADMSVYDAQFTKVMQNAGWTQDDPSFLATRAHQFCSVLHQHLATPELIEQKLVENSHLSMAASKKLVTTAMSIYPDCP